MMPRPLFSPKSKKARKNSKKTTVPVSMPALGIHFQYRHDLAAKFSHRLEQVDGHCIGVKKGRRSRWEGMMSLLRGFVFDPCAHFLCMFLFVLSFKFLSLLTAGLVGSWSYGFFKSWAAGLWVYGSWTWFSSMGLPLIRAELYDLAWPLVTNNKLSFIYHQHVYISVVPIITRIFYHQDTNFVLVN